MKSWKTIIELLRTPIEPKFVQPANRQAGIFGDYIPGQVAIGIANQIFGEDGWSVDRIELQPALKVEYPSNGAFDLSVAAVVGCTFYGIDDSGGSHAKQVSDVGVGRALRSLNKKGDGTASPPTPQNIDTMYKAAATDGIKRCLHQLGEALGLGLYRVDMDAIEAAIGQPTPAGSPTVESTATVKLPEDVAEIGDALGQAGLYEVAGAGGQKRRLKDLLDNPAAVKRILERRFEDSADGRAFRIFIDHHIDAYGEKSPFYLGKPIQVFNRNVPESETVSAAAWKDWLNEALLTVYDNNQFALTNGLKKRLGQPTAVGKTYAEVAKVLMERELEKRVTFDGWWAGLDGGQILEGFVERFQAEAGMDVSAALKVADYTAAQYQDFAPKLGAIFDAAKAGKLSLAQVNAQLIGLNAR